MSWRRSDLDKNRKAKNAQESKKNRFQSGISTIKCRIVVVYSPGETTGNEEEDKRLDLNTYRVIVQPIDRSNLGHSGELSQTAFVLNEEPHFITANYGIKGLEGKIVNLKYSPPLLASTGTISLEGVLNFGSNTAEPDREETLDTKAFDIGKAILGLLPF